MSWIAADPARYAGISVGNGQCVSFVKIAAGAPASSLWAQGMAVRGNAVPPGTVIATFDPDGSYGNHTDGSSHAAILIAEVASGLSVWDQWLGHPVGQRIIAFRAGAGSAANDGDQFCVAEPA